MLVDDEVSLVERMELRKFCFVDDRVRRLDGFFEIECSAQFFLVRS